MRRRGKRRVAVPAGLGQPGNGDKGNPTAIARRDAELEKVIRRSNFTSWFPFYDWREYFAEVDSRTAGQQLLDQVQDNGSALTFFDRVPANLTVGNIRQASQFPFPFDMYGLGIAVKGAEVFDVSADPGVTDVIGVDFRQVVAEHTRLEVKIRDATILVNHWAGLFPPGLGVTGGLATTANNADRAQSAIGVPHPMAFFRIGGPDIGEVIQCNKSDLIDVTLHFDQVLITLLEQWFPDLDPQVPKVSISIGTFLFGWANRKVF